MSVATQTMKKFINAPEDVVKESLAGLAAAHPDLVRVDFENQVVLRKDAPVAGKVVGLYNHQAKTMRRDELLTETVVAGPLFPSGHPGGRHPLIP